jgi:hypothetical protein
MSPPAHPSLKLRLLVALACALFLLACLAAIVRVSPTAAEVAGTALRNVFVLVTTPFILEFCVALLGLVLVMTWNQWNIDREGDGWVTMEFPASEEAKTDPQATGTAPEQPADPPER